MKSGREISIEFIESILWPILKSELPDDCDKLTVAVIGIGSDVTGMDDHISRDHHWGPRANVLVPNVYLSMLRPKIFKILRSKLPPDFQGYMINIDEVAMTAVCCTGIEDFFDYFLGTAELPRQDSDWLDLCEVDLYHVTSGVVVIDEPGDFSRRREHLAYYPENVWKKRIADWCVYITGRDAPYNVNRVNRREDFLTAQIYKSFYMKQVMEICFVLNRQYAPYTKWLNRTFRTLPRFVDRIAPHLDAIYEESDFEKNVHQMIDLNYIIAESIADLDLAPPPQHRPFDEGLTILTLYDTAGAIYNSIPQELRIPGFNRTEVWERLVREVLADSSDYHRKGHCGGCLNASTPREADQVNR